MCFAKQHQSFVTACPASWRCSAETPLASAGEAASQHKHGSLLQVYAQAARSFEHMHGAGRQVNGLLFQLQHFREAQLHLRQVPKCQSFDSMSHGQYKHMNNDSYAYAQARVAEW